MDEKAGQSKIKRLDGYNYEPLGLQIQYHGMHRDDTSNQPII